MQARASLTSNVIANYAGQIYTAAVTILLLPLQLKLLGQEAYGLVGFFSVLAGWLQLLDIGLTATLARETAKYRAGALDKRTYGELLRSVELFFSGVAVALALLVLVLSGPISQRWLRTEELAPSTVASAVALMGLVIAFRWQATLSRSVVVGLERQVFLNGITVLFATLRTAGVLLVLHWIEATPRAFFVYQACVAALEFLVLRVAVARALALGALPGERWTLAPLRRVASFSLTVAFTSSVNVLVTQMDKLLLSKLLPLSEYAHFSLVIMAAGGIHLLAGPIGQAVQPRLTFHFAAGNDPEFRATYSDATQLLSAMALTASFTLAAGARPFLLAWTGDAALAEHAAPVLAFYALGNGLMAVVAMAYYLQVARGDLSLHVRGAVVFGVLLLPAVAFGTIRAGMLGASVVWCAANLTFFLVWSGIVHRHHLPRFHLRWLFRDAILPGLCGSVPTLSIGLIAWSSLSRFQIAVALALIGASAVGMASLATTRVQRLLRARLMRA